MNIFIQKSILTSLLIHAIENVIEFSVIDYSNDIRLVL